MNRMPLKYLEFDRRKMKTYICQQIGGEPTELHIADGPEGELVAHLDPHWDEEDHEWDLHIETDCPEAVGVTEVYDHLRRQAMTWEEWHRELRGEMARWRVQTLESEVVSLRQARAAMAMAKQAIDRVLNSDVAVLGPTKGEAERAEQPAYQFQRLGDYWLARFTTEGKTEEGHFEDLEGDRHIAKLLARPDKPVKSTELQGLEGSPVADQAMKPQFASDAQSRQAVDRKLADLEQAIAQADDPAEKMELQEEYERLSAIAQASNERRLGPASPRERARKAVCNAITRAKRRIRRTMPEFAKFLDRSILPAGTDFVYTPAHPAPKWVL
jgi:hypothetical protein